MITIKDKKDCCGCTACYNACPKKAIAMQADQEGFLYPVIDQKKCVDSINNGENGLIVSMNGESVAEGLMQLSENQQLRNQLVENLKKEKTGNEEEINKYIQLIEENLN